MKYRYYFLAFFLCLAFSTQAQFNSVKKSLSQKPLQDRYVDFLTEEGYSPEIDSDGDVKFQYNERTYYITIDNDDPDFFRVARLANLKLSDPAEITQAKEICHQVTRDAKVAKVYWLKGVIWTSAEQIMANPDDFESIFARTMRLTDSAYTKFVETWKDRDQ